MNAEQDRVIDRILESLAEKYNLSLREWRGDRKNAFKDGHMLGYYEIKEAWLKLLEEGMNLGDLKVEAIKHFERAKREWFRDRRNDFKDGKLLACFEVMQLFPAGA